MANILQLMPYLEGNEMVFIQGLIKDMDDNMALQFANVYSSRRKDSQTILLTTLVGFFGVAGVQRFILGHMGMGFLYLLTCGLCFIGTIVDLINHKQLTFDFNSQLAQQVAVMVRGSN